MADKAKQQDLFPWKPEKPKILRFLKKLKLKHLLIAASILAAIIFGFNFNWIIELTTNEKIKHLLFNYWLIISVALMFILTLAIWLIPKWQVSSLNNKPGNKDLSEFDREKEQIKLRDDSRKTIAQIFGGAFFLLGLFATYNTFELNREGQVTERYSKAVALLDSKDISVRIGGLYALERIAKDSSKDHTTIMEILAAYIREKSKTDGGTEEEANNTKEKLNKNSLGNQDDFDEQLEEAKKRFKQNTKSSDEFASNILKTADRFLNNRIKAPTDIDAAASIINRRKIENDSNTLYFNFRGSNLRSVDFRAAKFFHGNFTDAQLVFTNFSLADLQSSNFFNSNLSYAKLMNANLRGANLSMANLKEANLFNTNLSAVDLSFCLNLELEQLKQAIINEQTQLPPTFQANRNELLENSKEKLRIKEATNE